MTISAANSNTDLSTTSRRTGDAPERGSDAGSIPDVNRAPSSVDEAVEALDTMTAWLVARRDPRAAFADVYAVITRRVRAKTMDPGSPLFLEPAWISHLTGLFCTRYFDYLFAALEGRPFQRAAWAVDDLHARHGDLSPAVQALLGINAHINADLALGLRDNVMRAGAAGDARLLARYRHDHDAVNSVLREAIPEILARLAHLHGCALSRRIGASELRRAIVSGVVLRALVAWRERVWGDLDALLLARTEVARGAIRARMDRRSSTLGRAIAALGAGGRALGRAAMRRRLSWLRGVAARRDAAPPGNPAGPSRAAFRVPLPA